MSAETYSTAIVKMLSEMGKELLSCDDTVRIIKKVLSDLGRLFSFDRVYVCKNYVEKGTGRLYFYHQIEWVSDPKLSIIANDKIRAIHYDKYPRWYYILSSGKPFEGGITSFPEKERNALTYYGIKSIVCVPIIFQGLFWGFIGFNECKKEKKLSPMEKSAVSLASIMLGSYIIRQRIAEDLKYNEQRLYNALEGSGEGVWDLDLATDKIYISEKGKSILGTSEFNNIEYIPLAKLIEFVVPEDRAAVAASLSKLSSRSDPVISSSFRTSINGNLRFFNVRGSVISKDILGKSIRAIGTFSDVTEKLTMENQLKEALLTAENANKAKSSFLATMSHEIRTPLNGMIGFLRLLVEHVPDGTGQEYLRIINNSTGTLLNIINSILDISKVESGSMVLDYTDCSLSDEMEAIARLFSASAHEKKVYLHTFIDSKIPMLVKCDQQRIRQIVSNLLNNALKFTSPGGFIYLEAVVEECSEYEVKIKFSIKDTGIGISESYLKDIFKPFTQADSSVSRKYGGSGLGLTIAYKFIELMDGELQIKSKEGEGSDFYFTLAFPIVEKAPPLEPVSGLKLAYLEYPKSAFDFKRNMLAMGCEPIEFESFEELLCADLKGYYAIVFSVFYTNQGILNDIQAVKNKYPALPILLITYPVDVSVFDVLNSLKIKTKIRPFSVRKFHSIVLSLMTSDTVMGEKLEEVPKMEFSGKVLVAEDNAVNCKLINILLSKYGVESTIVTNGLQALEKMENESFDIILMDVNMPVMDGMTATKEIRRREAGLKKVPVVALTANVMKEDAKEFLAAGMDHVLTKPIMPKELEEIFKKYLGNAS